LERKRTAPDGRRVNEYTVDLVTNRPDRFGNFATVPLTDIESALDEMNCGRNTLHADGFLLLATYAGKYLGDRVFVPIWEELSRR
jgi:6-methylsalicylate decarboxylase